MEQYVKAEEVSAFADPDEDENDNNLRMMA
jgi:hypothetical protein